MKRELGKKPFSRLCAASLSVMLALTMLAPQVNADNISSTTAQDIGVEEPNQELIETIEESVPENDIVAVSPDTGLVTTISNEYIPDSAQDVGEALESSYNSISNLIANYPNVRNQGSTEACWGFATTALAEFSLIKQGKANKSIDLSELQVAYSGINNTVVDPLGGTSGDYFQGNSDHIANLGGFSFDGSYQSLLRGQGMTTESAMPFSSRSTVVSQGLTQSQRYENNSYDLTDVRIIDPRTNANKVKQAIKDNGAAGTYIYTGEPVAGNYKYICDDNKSFYCSDSGKTTNHAVTIVGWDDNYDKNNFTNSLRNPGQLPENNGAWLIRNSWSDASKEEFTSYFWLSYEDKSYNNAYVMVFDNHRDYNNYEYDGGGSTFTLPSQYNRAANIFTASSGVASETLKEVSISQVKNVDVNYTIEVYTDLTNAKNPTSGTLQSAATTTGTTSDAGVYRVHLNSDVVVNAGSKYSIVVTTTDNSGNPVGADFEAKYANASWYTNGVDAVDGQSYIYNEGSWTPMRTVDYPSRNIGNARIKAYTTNNGVGPFDSSIYVLSNTNTVVAGAVVNGIDKSQLEYRWLSYDINAGGWSQVTDWTRGNEWVNWNPGKSGDYLLYVQIRYKDVDTVLSSSCAGVNHNHYISGICQIPNPNGTGYLLGLTSYDNPDNTYRYEIAILDCTKLASGDPSPWVLSTGQVNVGGATSLWDVWNPIYGYYWTLFRVYDSSGNVIDEICYGFENV